MTGNGNAGQRSAAGSVLAYASQLS